MRTLASRLRWALPWLLGLALVSISAPCAAQSVHDGPSDESDAAARAAFQAGHLAYADGRFAEALAHFELAYELTQQPKLLFVVARAAEQDGRRERAIEAYAAFQEALPDSDKHRYVEARLAKLRADERESDGDAATAEKRVPSPSETAALAVQTEPSSPARAGSKPAARHFWQRGWFWGAVAVVVVAGAVTGGLLVARSRSGPADRDPDGRFATLEVR